MKNYFDRIIEKLESMSDKDFDELLIESGIESCPYELEKRTYNYEFKNDSNFENINMEYIENINGDTKISIKTKKISDEFYDAA